MDIRELSDLISIRQYVMNASANFSIDRAAVNDLGGILLMLDKKIIDILRDKEFKDYIDYEDVQEVKNAVIMRNNIKSGLKK
jgi:hypothetical protein